MKMLELTDQVARIEINHTERYYWFWRRSITEEVMVDYSLHGEKSNPRIYVYVGYISSNGYFERINDDLLIRIKLFIYNYIKENYEQY